MASGAASRIIVRCLRQVVFLTALAVDVLPAQPRPGTERRISNDLEPTQFALGYAADAFLPARGGVHGNPVALDNLDLLAHLDLDGLLGLPGTSIRLHVQSSHGGSVGAEVGDLQGISNLEAPSEWRLYEAWIEQQIGSPRLTFLAGVYDLNSDFDVIPAAADLLNGSFGLGPEYSLSGKAGLSTYPNPGLGARIKIQPVQTVYGLVAVSDPVSGSPGSARFSLDDEDGALISFEAGYTRVMNTLTTEQQTASQPQGRGRGQGAGRPGPRHQRRRAGRGRIVEEVNTKVAIGGWAYTQKLQRWNPTAAPSRSWGLYVLGEKLLHQNQDASRQFSGFARGGAAADAVNQLNAFLGGGVTCRGILGGRLDDVAALGIAHGRNGSPFLRAQREAGALMDRSETVLELTYRAQINRFFVVQPDVQWVLNPGMDPDLSDALVFGLRAHLSLEYR